MTSRRTFLKAAVVAGAVAHWPHPTEGVGFCAAAEPAMAAGSGPAGAVGGASGAEDRRYWVSVMQRIARPVVENLAAGTLRKNMPVEASGGGRAQYTHLEAVGRLLCGIAPWLSAEAGDDAERQAQQRFVGLVQRGLDVATDPKGADFLNYSRGGQALVDTAFLAQGILRNKAVLWTALEPRVQQQIVAALKASRGASSPTDSNWVLFASTVEAALLEMGEEVRHDRLEIEIRRMVGWYKGDGWYGDGAFFHCDYYNSFVIHPMLVDGLAVLARHDGRFAEAQRVVLARARRYAEIQERLIAPDGSFPSIGRSTCYRFGAFQALAQVALLRELPETFTPAQVRCGLTAVIRRMTEAPGTFDENGWLRIGFCGHQPALGETYISTGSLYLCLAGMLPLGLPASDPFWSGAARRWTQQAIWGGENVRADHAMTDVGMVAIPEPG